MSPITPIRPVTTPTIPCRKLARYRDYIIDSFNRDKPYDQFVREQLAGDILARDRRAADYAESVVATGFLALSRRYGTGPYELWHLTLEDAIETTGRAFLGLTLRCARCHDHKFDPVAQTDYYALYGMFASTSFPWAGSEETQSKGFPRMKFVPLVEPARAETEAQGVSRTARRVGADHPDPRRSRTDAKDRTTAGRPEDRAEPGCSGHPFRRICPAATP